MQTSLTSPGKGRWIEAHHLSKQANFSFLHHPTLRHIIAELQGPDHYDVRYVGGCVRDALLGVLAQDIDVATPESPHKAMNRLEKAGFKTFATGLAHGTITVVHQGLSVEVTTLRQDTQTNGRHAHVSFTKDWDIDASRRDFTLNALSCCPDGRIYDPVSGYSDLMQGRVRFIGTPDLRIQEDYLRILRFFRFSIRFTPSGNFDADGLAACKRLAQGLTTLSSERIQSEMLKLLKLEHIFNALPALQKTGLWPFLLPDIPDTAQEKYLVSCISWEKAGFSSTKLDTALPRLACLLKSRQAALQLAQNWKLSHQHKALLLKLTSKDIQTACLTFLAQWYDAPEHTNTQSLLNQLCFKYPRPVLYQLLNLVLAKQTSWSASDPVWSTLIQTLSFHPQPVFPISGKDLVHMGIPPGPKIGDILRQTQHWWITQAPLASKEHCLTHVQLLNTYPDQISEMA